MDKSAHQGMTLIEVLIAVFILALISAGIGTLVQQMGLVTNNMQAQSGRTSLESVLQGILSDETLCTARLANGITFNAPTAGSEGRTDLTFNLGDGSPQTVVAENQTLSKYNVTVMTDGFQLVVPAGSTPTVVSGNNVWIGYLEIATSKSRQAVGGEAMRRSGIGSMTVILNGANQIIGCYGSPTYACPAGFVQTGPNPSTDCVTIADLIGSLCPAGQVPVSNGAGGVTCQPYSPPPGTPTPTPTGSPPPTATPTPTSPPGGYVWACVSPAEVGNSCNLASTGSANPCSPGPMSMNSGGRFSPSSMSTYYPGQMTCAPMATCDPIHRTCVTAADCQSAAFSGMCQY